MTRDEIDDLMRDNGIVVVGEAVYALVQLVIDAEREACAKVCETGVDTEHPTVKGHIMKNFGASSHLATAIRARSNT